MVGFVATASVRLVAHPANSRICIPGNRFLARRSSRQAVAHRVGHRALTVMAAAKEGNTAPDFNRTDTDGNLVSLSGMRDSNVVLFFMAGAGMGCTTQSCAFRDAAAELNDLDAKIIAVSARTDGAAFKENNSLTYPVINDADGTLQALYGVPKTFGLIPGRVTYIIDKQGIIRKVYNSQFSIAQHVSVAKDTVRELATTA